MTRPTSPCYDRETGEDCPRRKVGCASTCKRWAEYAYERDIHYKRVAAEREVEGMMADIGKKRHTQYRERQQRDRLRKRNKKYDA